MLILLAYLQYIANLGDTIFIRHINAGYDFCLFCQICVSECTDTYYTYLETKILEAAPTNPGGGMLSAERAKMLCKYNVDPSATVSLFNWKKINRHFNCISYKNYRYEVNFLRVSCFCGVDILDLERHI